ncbi:MAG: response regulator transcription factor [Syntrophaceae bacterium]|nr:response regulator transcription factor [Syntrophaceae bacterium]
MHHKIAIIEDDDLIRNMVLFHLEKNGFSVCGFASAEAMMEAVGNEPFDLIILDLVLPGISGQDFLKAIRGRGNDTPVLMLTVKEDIATRVTSFNFGADDYMIKPFNMDELLARVKALIRRSLGKRRVPSSRIFVINGHRIDTSTRECSSNIGDVILSEKEMNLLLFFLKHSQETISRADILEEVWGMDVVPTPRTIDNFILKFRKLFEDNPDKPRIFVSVRSRGYRFHP